jgi:hypothetical protein
MFFDAVEVLSDTEKFDPAQFAPRGDRYDSQRICLGEQLHDTIQKLKLFMVLLVDLFLLLPKYHPFLFFFPATDSDNYRLAQER